MEAHQSRAGPTDSVHSIDQIEIESLIPPYQSLCQVRYNYFHRLGVVRSRDQLGSIVAKPLVARRRLHLLGECLQMPGFKVQ